MSISSNFFNKPFRILCILKLGSAHASRTVLTRVLPQITSSIPGILRPEIRAAPPPYNPDVPPELPHITSVFEFDTTPTEKPSDPGPISPGPNPGPELPGPPHPSPPMPDGPRPPMPSPTGEPDAFPPHGPDVIPPKPPEPGPSQPKKPDIQPPFMGSYGFVFY